MRSWHFQYGSVIAYFILINKLETKPKNVNIYSYRVKKTQQETEIRLFLIGILKEFLCWLVKPTDCCHYFQTEQEAHTWTPLLTAAMSNICLGIFVSSFLAAEYYRFCFICHLPAPLEAILPHKVACLFFQWIKRKLKRAMAMQWSFRKAGE